MKYMCRTCKKECDDILKHLMTVHKFSKAIVESSLQTNPNCFKSSFVKLTIVESSLQTNPNCFKSSFVKLKNDRRSKTTIQEKGRY